MPQTHASKRAPTWSRFLCDVRRASSRDDLVETTPVRRAVALRRKLAQRTLVALSVSMALPTLGQADGPEVRRLRVQRVGDASELVIEGEFPSPDYALRARDGGRTVVVDVVGATLPSGGLSGIGTTRLVSGVTAATTARGVRIEVSLATSTTYHAEAQRGRIRVRFDEPSTGASRGSGSQPAPREGAAASAGGAGTSAAGTAPRPAARAVTVESVHVERRNGRDRVVVRLDRSAPFRVQEESDGVSRLRIDGAQVAASAAGLLRGEGSSLIRRVRVRNEGTDAVVYVQRRGEAMETAIRQGDRIVWLFGRPMAGPDRPRSRTIAQEQAMVAAVGADGEMDTSEAAAFLTDVPMQIAGARAGRRYAGRRIDLDFKDADIHNILRLLAEVGGVNVVTSDDVSGTVTIRMRNVPWDQALDVILQAKGLGMVRRGNLIRVAPMETLEKERESAIARQKQQEQLAPLETRLVPVSYATAENLSARVGELLSDRGSVSVDERTNVMIVRDIVDNLDDAEELVRTLDTQTPQVLIEARIVEATSQYTRDVGIQWGGDATMSTATGNPTGLAFPSNVGLAGGNYDAETPTAGLSPFVATPASPSNFAVNLPAITGTGQGGAIGLSLGSVGGNVNLSVRLSAAEANGVVRIISSPRILTLDNHEAHIAQGTLIPYSQVSAQGVQTAFQEAKLELNVRPHVTSDGSVSMHVKVTRDEPDFTRTSTRGDPTILKREAETDLLTPDGHTAVIGGIYTRNTGRNVNQVPFFGDIPILGILFQRRVVRDDRNELLIFLTPRIVNRAESIRD